MALFSSKFPGKCLTCDKPYAQGDKIFWKRGMKSAQHALCSEEGKKTHAALVESKTAVPLCDTVIPSPTGLSYLPYQIAGIQYALQRTGTLIADEMGLGKTIQGVGLVNADENIKSVIIVCPKSLKLNWQNELKKWLTRQLSVGLVGDNVPDTDVVIINYNGLTKHVDKICERDWDLMIVDEIHLIKNPDAIRTKNVFNVAKKAKRRLGLSGSPMPNRTKELWTTLQFVCPETWDPPGRVKKNGKFIEVNAGEGAGWFKFVTRYCNAHRTKYGFDTGGASNLDELHDRLRESCMIRRLKKDVLSELPPKRRQLIELSIDEKSDDIDEEYERSLGDSGFYEGETDAEVAKNSGDVDDYVNAVNKMQKSLSIAFNQLSAARRRMGIRKVKYAIEHIKELLENVDKIIVFAHHHEVIDSLRESLNEFGVVEITGKTDVNERQQNVELFQNDPSYRVFIGSIGAAGVGLTLTAASTVVFVELDWVPSNISQAEDRAHRITQKNSVLVQHLVIPGTIDAKLTSFLVNKQAIIDNALDRNDDFATIERDDFVKNNAKKHDDPVINTDEVRLIHDKLRWLAARCDGAASDDSAGFNRFDSSIGKSLASRQSLTQKQAAYAQKLVIKYRRQLSEAFSV